MIIDVVHTEDTDGHRGPQRRTFWGTTIIRNWTAISRTVTCPLISADIASLYATECNILNTTIRGLLMVYVKLVLKLIHIYITSVYFLYLYNGLTATAIPEAND